MARTTQNDPLGLNIIADEKSIETVAGDKSLAMASIELERFMNERVLVEVPASTDKNSMPYVHLNVNGLNQIIPRGRAPVFIKRMFLEVLARLKETSYTQEEITGRDGRQIITNESTALVYPFRVVRDDNPLGAPWLNRLMEEAA